MCTSQDRLGSAAVTTNPYISVISNTNNYFSLIIHAYHMPVGMGHGLCPGHPQSAMKADWISSIPQLQFLGREENLEQIGLFLKGFHRELVYGFTPKASHMAIFNFMEARDMVQSCA